MIKFVISLLPILLTACANSIPKAQPISSTDNSLAEASYSVSRSIESLSEIAQAAHPMQKMDDANPAEYGMAGLTSIDWSGPVEPIVNQLAQAANYKLRVLGNSPAIPVLVTVYAQNKPLSDVLRNIGYQCGRRANVVIYPETRILELRYAQN